MTNTNTITFDLAWYTILNQYSTSLRRKVCDAVLSYAATGEIPTLKGMSKLAFELIANEINKQKNNNNCTENSTHTPDTQEIDNNQTETMEICHEQIEHSPVSHENFDFENEPLFEDDLEDSKKRLIPNFNPPDDENLEDMTPYTSDNIGEITTFLIDEEEFDEAEENPRPASKPKKTKTKPWSLQPQHKNIGKMSCTQKGTKLFFRRH